MRIDVRDQSTWPPEGPQNVKVFLNGRWIGWVIVADTEAGICLINEKQFNSDLFTEEEMQYEKNNGLPADADYRIVSGEVTITTV